MKLYLVHLRGCGEYRKSYVVADNPTEAYMFVKTFLDKLKYGFEAERELYSIELLADADHYPKCGCQLFLNASENHALKVATQPADAGRGIGDVSDKK